MFTHMPNKLSSLYSELSYTYYNSSTGDMTLQIYEDESGELLGVKKFYSTNTAQVNIAPHVRAYALQSMESYPAGFMSTYRNGNLLVYLKVPEYNDTSLTRQYTISRSDIDLRGLISSLPAERSISDGDSDQLYIAAETGDTITVVVKHYLTSWSDSYERPYVGGEFTESLASTLTYTESISSGNIAIFNFVAESIASGDTTQIEKVVVSVSQNSETIAELTYNIVERPQGAIRLAWISDSGSVEHYTFPVVKESYVGDSFQHTYTLTSAFVGYATRAALAEIVHSPRVWVDNYGVYLDATAEDGALSVSSSGTLGTVDIRLSYTE